MLKHSVDDVAAIVRDVTLAEVMPRFNALDQSSIKAKTWHHDLVTEADNAAEEALGAKLAELFPQVPIIGEEAADRTPGILDLVGRSEESILVDPLDGTSNFVAGIPLFGCMVAILRGAETVAGVIYDPVNDITVTAERGSGAWLTRHRDGAKERLRVSTRKDISEMTIGLSWRYFQPNLRSKATRNLPRFASGFHFRTAAHEYRLAASGHVDLLAYNRIKPWDHAAGTLIHSEAGGYSAHFDGSKYLPTHDRGGVLVAPDASSWRDARAALLED